MKFLILTQYFPPEVGAPQVRLASMLRELKKAGHSAEVVTALPNHPTGQIHESYRGRFLVRDDFEGVPVLRTWLYAATGAGARRMLNYGSFTASCVAGLACASRPDVLFIESPPLFLAAPAIVAARAWRCASVLNVADLWPDSVRDLGLVADGPMLRAAEALELWSYRHSTFVNAVTDGIRQTLVEKKHVPARKVLFLPNGVDLERFSPMPADEPLAKELRVAPGRAIVYAGTLGIAQGLEVALHAMKRLQDEGVNDLRLVLLGDGSAKTMLVGLAESLGLANVTFLDPRPPEFVPRLYSLALAGLVALKDIPLFEGARPSKMFPIMGTGRPVLYSGRGEGADLVEQNQAGLVVPPEDPIALAEAIKQLAASPELVSSLGQRGREFVMQNYSWQRLVGAWIRDLEERMNRGHVS
jgi:glycosyltransferase involved in cell wall biosynthesis